MSNQPKKLVKLHESYREITRVDRCGTCRFILDEETNCGPVDHPSCFHPLIDRDKSRIFNIYVNPFTGICKLFEHKQSKKYDEEGTPIIICKKGGNCEWGTDGQHSNIFCKKCFNTFPKKD